MANGTCSVDGCTKAARTRGWCSAHYERWRKHGDVNTVLPPVAPPIRRTQFGPCTVEGCTKEPAARGFCPVHYQAWRLYGSPTASKKRKRTFCTVDGCDQPSHGRGLCGKHYLRWYEHGDAEYERAKVTECRVEGCDNPPRSQVLDLCEVHYYRIRRHGDPLTVVDTRRDDAKYRAAHARISHDRGKARSYPCVDCGRRAEHWSYMHTDPDALMSDTGQPYSLDPSHYVPRCAPCHAVFDGTGANQYSHH